MRGSRPALLSGWCQAPEGARPKHEGCAWERCGCACHDEKEGD